MIIRKPVVAKMKGTSAISLEDRWTSKEGEYQLEESLTSGYDTITNEFNYCCGVDEVSAEGLESIFHKLGRDGFPMWFIASKLSLLWKNNSRLANMWVMTTAPSNGKNIVGLFTSIGCHEVANFPNRNHPKNIVRMWLLEPHDLALAVVNLKKAAKVVD